MNTIANEKLKEIVVNGKKYKINPKKNNYNGNKKEQGEGISFIGCGITIGVVNGSLYKCGSEPTKEYIEQVEQGISPTPFVMFCTTITQANAAAENLKNDKKRFNTLASEIQKQRIMDKAQKQQIKETLVNAMEQEQSEEMSRSQDKTKEQAKRLALNNGIYRPSDNF